MKRLIFFGVLLFVSCQLSHSQTWKELLERADKYNSAKRSDSAIAFGRLALEKAKHDFGEVDTSVALVLHRLGAYHHAFKAVNEDSFYLAALAVWEKIPTANALLVAKTLNNLGTFYSDVGKFERGEYYHTRTIALKEKYGTAKDELSLAVSYHNLGGLYRGMGKYDLAEEYLQRALKIRERKLTLSDPATANTINVLGNVYEEIGNYDKAQALFELALNAPPKSAQDTVWRVGFLSNLGVVLREKGEVSRAESVCTVALSIQNDPRYYDSEIKFEILDNLSQVYSDQGNYEKSRQLLEEALQLLSSVRNAKMTFEALVLNNMGTLALHTGKFLEAESLFQKSLDIRKQFLGERNLSVANNIADIAMSYRLQGKTGLSMEYAFQAMHMQDRVLDMLSRTMSEKDLLAYLSNRRRAVDIYLSSFVDSIKHNNIDDETAAEVVLQNKGALAERMFQRQHSLYEEKSHISSSLLEEFRDVQYRLSRLFVHESETESSPQRKSLEDSLSTRFDELESAIARNDKTFNQARENRSLSLSAIKALLPVNSVLIEYLKFEYFPTGQEQAAPHTLALVVSKNKKCWLEDLGESSLIDNDILNYRKHFLQLAHNNQAVTQADQKAYEELSVRLYRRLWNPIAGKIANGATVLIGADAALNLISFAGIVDEHGTYLIERHPIHYVSAGRDLIRMKEIQKSGKGFIAFGDPDYDAPPGARKGTAASSLSGAITENNDHRVRNVRSGCGALSTMTVQPLPGTRAELTALEHSYDGKKPALFLGPDASEENFKQDARGHRYIHVATHGYFLEGECASGTEKRAVPTLANENPLLQSGLFLAGANLHGEGAESTGVEDGVLTALEVSGMDLRGTGLVVLSACETGLGKVEQGEGVYGLRRSFQMAGARTVVSSLWQIPDNETRKFMKELYSQKASTYPELLQKVSIRQLTELRKRGRVTHPYTWAGFVATGDWKIK